MSTPNDRLQLAEVVIRCTPAGLVYPREVTLWQVTGITEMLFPTKIAAEMAARLHFPNEDYEKNYARIFYLEFVASRDL